MYGVLSERHVVTQSQVDSKGLITIGSVARIMQDLCMKHLLKYAGLGSREFSDYGKSIVVCWSEINFFRTPSVGEEIEARVWAGPYKPYLFSRKYDLRDTEGNVLATAAGLYTVIDQTIRSITSPSLELKRVPAITVPGECTLPSRSIRHPDTFHNAIERTVVNDEIDCNRHLNNARYLDWALDLLDESFFNLYRPTGAWIRYSKEVFERTKVQLQFEWDAETALFVRGVVDGKETFLLRISFCKERGKRT